MSFLLHSKRRKQRCYRKNLPNASIPDIKPRWMTKYCRRPPRTASLCRVKYNGNCVVNDNKFLSDEYLGKTADVQNELLTVKEYIKLYKHAPQQTKTDGVAEYKYVCKLAGENELPN